MIIVILKTLFTIISHGLSRALNNGKKIEQTAQAILDARALYPDSSLADLYDELTMPPELRKAHHQNDMAVMQAYGFTKGSEAYKSEAACVVGLMKLYQKKVEDLEKDNTPDTA